MFEHAEWALVFWTALLVFATIVLAVVAAFQDIIRSWFTRPKLVIQENDFSKAVCSANPNSHHHKLHRMYDPDYEKEVQFNSYYFRAIVFNKGNISANNVEVIINDVSIYEKDKWIPKKDFVYENLIWSSFTPQGEVKIYCEYISPKTGQYINIGHIFDPKYYRGRDYKELFGADNPRFHLEDVDEVLFIFDVNMKSIGQYYIVKPGRYRFNITVGSANAKSVTQKYELNFSGKWNEDETIMTNQEINIKPVS